MSLHKKMLRIQREQLLWVTLLAGDIQQYQLLRGRIQATMELVQARDHLMHVMARTKATTELVQARGT